MKKNNIIGWVLIGAIMVGFMFFQSKQIEKQQAYVRQQEAIARAQLAEQMLRDSLEQVRIDSLKAAGLYEEPKVQEVKEPEIQDAALAGAKAQDAEFITLQNDLLEVAFTTRGGQPYSARIKDYKNYDKSDLYLFRDGQSEYNVKLFAGELVSTKDFTFQIASQTDSSVVMRLPFSNGGYIEQAYTLDGYQVRNTLSFEGLEIARNVYSYDIEWNVNIPRMEKGFRNEAQYSLSAYLEPGSDSPEEYAKGRSEAKKVRGNISWVAYHQQFFSAIFRALDNWDEGELSTVFADEKDNDVHLMYGRSLLRKELRGKTSWEHEFYFGPNSYNGMKALGQHYEKTIPLGGSIIGIFTKYVIIPVFNFLKGFDLNFGIIILLMTLFIKIVVFPLAYKSLISSAKMQILRPEVEKINVKYPKQEDAMKKQQETMALYKRAGANMMGGCLPMLLQFPILWAMFRFFPASIELRQQPFLWAEDLSAYDSFLTFPGGIPLLGDHISLFALLMAVSMFFFTKLTSGSMVSNDANGKMMRMMTFYFMPVMMFFICNSLSSGLSYYYLLSNIITMIETFIIRKWVVKPEDVYARLKATEGKPLPKSKWQKRLEEAQRMQQQRNARR